MDRLERLVNLTAALLDTERPLTRHEIHERVPGYATDEETFRRAFERDKDSLRSMGVPISLERVEPRNPESVEGYRIRREDYELPDPGLSAEELRALHIAVAAVQLSTSDAETALRKLGGTLGESDVLNLALLESNSALSSVFDALSVKCAVKFSYKNEVRIVDPHRLSHYRGRWYLAGFDRSRNDVRSYRIDRFDGGVQVLRDSPVLQGSKSNQAFSLRPWEMGDDDPVTVTFKVDASQVDWVAAQVSREAKRSPAGDGSAIFEMQVTNVAAFRSFVLGLLEHAEILSPEFVRDDLVNWLNEFVS